MSLSINPLYAQTTQLQKLEGQIGGGVIFPNVNPNGGLPGYTGFQLLGELRYNLNYRFDIGFQYSFNKFDIYEVFDGVTNEIRTHAVSVLFDYNWRLCDKVNLFTGVGAGCLMPADSWNALGYNYGTTRHYYPVAFPRVGIELFDQLRLSMEYRITKIRYGYFWVDIGYVFGGRIQKY